jgi:glycine/D-amino acid oxidase-like deaminating enzyme
LQGDTRADVCVIGAGIAGCSAALSLAERGYRVAVLEARRIGWGASGRSGGQVIYGLAAEQDQLTSLVGAQDARRIWDMSLSAIAQLRQRIARHAIDCDWVDGQMLTAIKARQWRALQDWHHELTNSLGYASARLIGNDELRTLLGSQRYIGALYDTNGGCRRTVLREFRHARLSQRRRSHSCPYGRRQRRLRTARISRQRLAGWHRATAAAHADDCRQLHHRHRTAGRAARAAIDRE